MWVFTKPLIDGSPPSPLGEFWPKRQEPHVPHTPTTTTPETRLEGLTRLTSPKEYNNYYEQAPIARKYKNLTQH
jgi:hypothetical protein